MGLCRLVQACACNLLLLWGLHGRNKWTDFILAIFLTWQHSYLLSRKGSKKSAVLWPRNRKVNIYPAVLEREGSCKDGFGSWATNHLQALWVAPGSGLWGTRLNIQICHLSASSCFCTAHQQVCHWCLLLLWASLTSFLLSGCSLHCYSPIHWTFLAHWRYLCMKQCLVRGNKHITSRNHLTSAFLLLSNSNINKASGRDIWRSRLSFLFLFFSFFWICLHSYKEYHEPKQG